MITKIFAVGSVAAMLLAGCCDKHCEENAQGKQTALPEDSLEAYVRAFMQLPQPGYTGLKRNEAYYKPMVEVVKFLTENGFT